MALIYDQPPAIGALRQGEVIGSVWEHRPLHPPTRIPRGRAVAVKPIWHALMIVLSPDCDLLWDYQARFDTDPETATDLTLDQHPDSISHILLCDMYGYGEFRPRFQGLPEVWGRVKTNQDGRYHRLDGSAVGEGPGLQLHELYLDFKKVIALPTDVLYEGLLGGDIERVAVVREFYIHDLIQRFYGFLSRIALPD